jgi:pimeloyl-ACP methyl ester carboxylesterase
VKQGLISSITAFSLVLTASTVPADATPLDPTSVHWAECAVGSTVDCATLRVPVDHARPRAGSTTLQLTRARATGPGTRLGVLISPPGQPVQLVSPALRARFDVVGYTERSLDAAPRSAHGCAKPTDVTYFPQSEADFTQLRTENRAAFTHCAGAYGPLWRRLDSASEADDIDTIRDALREPQISFLGTTGGDIVGELYAERFPARVQAMVLDGNADHSVDTAAGYLSAFAGAAERTYGAFADWCARTPVCPMYGHDLRAFYDDLRAKTEQDAFFDLRGYPIDLPSLAGATEYFLLFPHYGWLDFGWHLRDIHNRDQQSRPAVPEVRAATTAAADSARTAGPVAPVATRPAAPFTGPSPAACEDWNFGLSSYADLLRLRDALTRSAPLLRMSGLLWGTVLGCVGWPGPITNPPHRLSLTKPVPVLVVTSAFNPLQPVDWGPSLARQLPGAKTLSYEGPGSSAYLSSPCARQAVEDFLITRTAPARTTCPAIWP